jgi:hypothetical protein
MAYFAVNLLNVVVELLDNSKREAVQIIGCQMLTRFIYSQVDGTYTHNIENLVHKVSILARGTEEDPQKRVLRASSLQCLSAMLWFMTEFSHIFVDFDEIVHATLDNYKPDKRNEQDGERGEAHHNWVDEVVRCEARGVGSETTLTTVIVRPKPAKRDLSLLTREEIETPEIWGQICLQRMVELAKESTTMRRILDPMFVYFDSGLHWLPRYGLATMVLSDMSYFFDNPESQQLILSAVVHHLDHKNVSHDPQIKSNVIQTATTLACQIRSVAVSDIGFVSDLCRHLRKSLQATVDSVGEQELNLNIALQNSIEDCLLESAKGIADARPLYDMMARTLENLPPVRVAARATIGSLIILAHMISLANVSSHSQQVFPEALLGQLLKIMLNQDVEIRVGGHQIFSVLLIRSSSHPRHDSSNNTRRWHSNTACAFASITALLDKLRREKDEKHVDVSDDTKENNNNNSSEEEWKQGWTISNSPNFHKLSSIIDLTAASTNLAESELSIMKFNEDQMPQLLSAFWIQANLPDNLPSNFEALAHSFCLTLISSRFTNLGDNLVVRFFQLPLSLRKISLNPFNGTLAPAYQRSLLVLSTAMLMFAAKIYQIPDLNDLLKPLVECDVDQYIGISDDLQVYVKPQADLRDYGSPSDNKAAASLLSELRAKIFEFDEIVIEILAQNLSGITETEAEELNKQLSEDFAPDESFMFGSKSMAEINQNQMGSHSKESLSFDGDFSSNSTCEDEVTSEPSVLDFGNRFVPKVSNAPSSVSHIISIGQLLESALEVAGQVAGTSVSNSPLPFNTMAGHCEALGTDTRKKLSTWLTYENHNTKPAADLDSTFNQMEEVPAVQGALLPSDPWLALRLPPASPFDNFLRAARI